MSTKHTQDTIVGKKQITKIVENLTGVIKETSEGMNRTIGLTTEYKLKIVPHKANLKCIHPSVILTHSIIKIHKTLIVQLRLKIL